MNSHLLYFPNINVPDTAWTYRSILYYDTLSAIVPEEYQYGQVRYEHFMQKLVDRHLVLPINPMEMMDIARVVEQWLLSYIQLPEYDINHKRRTFQHSRNRTAHIPYLISEQKFLGNLIYHLEHEGLAIRSVGKFFDVEPALGKKMMFLLTNAIAQRKNLNPVTNKAAHVGIRFSNQHGSNAPEAAKRRQAFLEGILPGPEFINLDKLMDFKINYQNELYRFRLLVEEIALDEKYDQEDLLYIKIAQVLDLREELTARMTEDKWEKIGNTTFHMITEAAMAALAGDVASLLGLGKSLKDTVSEFNTDVEQFYEPSGIKYLALVHKHLTGV